MPPASSKGKTKTGSQSRDVRRSRSRNTTPISGQGVAATVEHTTSPSGMHSALSQLGTPSAIFIEDIFNNGGGATAIPTPETLHAMLDEVKNRFLPAQNQRFDANEKFMRHLVVRRKARMEHQHHQERANREAEERKHKLKKLSKKREPDEDRPLAVGAHGLARQDGTDIHKVSRAILNHFLANLQPPPSATGTGKMGEAASPSGSDDSHQPAKAPAVPAYQTFGPDPTKFDDPTIYHIRDIADDTPEYLKKEILGVAHYPKSDLHDLTPGTPPDKDFSNPKPQTQVNASVFANYAEPYIRPLTEEDLSFLKERGDRVTPFQMPRRGTRHYKEIWADEDGAMAIDSTSDKLPPNEPRGSMDLMNDDVAETDAIAPGPVVARLLSALRSEGRSNTGDANGTTNGEMEMDGEGGDSSSAPQAPATHMPESSNPAWKTAPNGKLDYASMDERAMQELIHIGFLSADDKPDYDGHFDDEVAARLRYLQDELRRQSIVNGARKARLLELGQHRMAQQEFCAIEDDLNNQLNAAYLKRNRNLGKGKKNNKRPGGAGGGSHVVQAGGGTSRGLGEEIRALMEKKERWTNVIGPVVDYGKAGIPKESIFDEETMKRFVEKEQEGWTEVEE